MDEIKGLVAFEKAILAKNRYLLIDFWGPTCAPCVDVNRILSEMETEFEGEVSFHKVNAEDELDIAVFCGVRGLPTLVLYRDGKALKRWIGFSNRKKFTEELRALVRTG